METLNNGQAALVLAASKYWVDATGILHGPRGVLVAPKKNKRGYPRVSIRARKVGIDQKVSVHRIAAYHKFGPRVLDPRLVVRHLDGNKANFNPSNLALGTDLDNWHDDPPEVCAKRLRSAKLAAVQRRLFDDETTEAIRREYATGTVGYTKLAEKYKCARTTIRGLVNHKVYRVDAESVKQGA